MMIRMASSLAPAMPQRSVVIDDTVVLKIAIGSGLDKVAVSTFGGLYTADFSVDGNPGEIPLSPFCSVPPLS
jgi:hypothetical protein